MNRYLLVLLFVPFLSARQDQQPSSPAPGQTASQPANNQAQSAAETQIASAKADAEEGIKHVLIDQIEAWNHGNLQGYMNGYWRSPELTFFSGGTVTKGWQPTLQRYQQRYQGEGREMGKLEFQDLTVEVLSLRVAVVTGKWQLTMSDGKQSGGLFTLIFKRMPAGWRIVHDHTSAG